MLGQELARRKKGAWWLCFSQNSLQVLPLTHRQQVLGALYTIGVCSVIPFFALHLLKNP
jgi:hypothetical protein